MTRRSRWALVVGCLVVAVTATTALLLRPRHEPSVSHESFKRLRIWSSPGQVLAVLGPPDRQSERPDKMVLSWDRDVRIEAFFNARRQAYAFDFSSPDSWEHKRPEPRQRPAILDELLDWLGIDF